MATQKRSRNVTHYLIVCAMIVYSPVTAICDRYTGPQGAPTDECMRFKSYNFKAQKATCQTSKYINETSEGLYRCAGGDTYCWFPCMCDLHHNCMGGSVYTDCSCDPNEPAVSHMSDVSITLPLSCFERSAQCSWYTYCLRKKYPCVDMDEVSHAISFNEIFCDLYSKHFHRFSSGTRLWMDETKRCHISTLMPLLSQPVELSPCNQIVVRASASNVHCMNNALYLCALNWTEKLQIFWTLVGSRAMSNSDPLRQVWTLFSTSDHVNPADERLDLEYSNVTSIELLMRLKITARNSVTIAKITDKLALKRHWAERGLTWFGYNTEATITSYGEHINRNTQINIRVLLATNAYDLNAPDAPEVNMTEAHEVTRLGNAVRDRLQLTIDGAVVDIDSMTACSDVDCKNWYLYVKARPQKVTLTPGVHGNAGPMLTPSLDFHVVCAVLISLIQATKWM